MATKKLDYERYSDAELAAQMMPRQAVPDADTWLAGDERLTAALKARRTVMQDQRYGPGPRQVADIYPAGRAGSPVLVFIHGGYWRALSKEVFGYIAGPLQAAGITVILPGYDLCPAISLTAMVEQIAEALTWCHQHAAAFNGDPGSLHIAGHSAGAHLAAMMLSRDWGAGPGPEIRTAMLISGLYDLTPIPRLPVQADIRLPAAAIRDLSPLFLPLRSDARCVIAVGGDEPPLWVAQSKAYYDKLRLAGRTADLMILPETHHYSIIRNLAEADNTLASLLLKLVLDGK